MLRAMACNNAWANHRLLRACALLTNEEFAAPRTGFFPSLRATLNHILTVDWFYVDAIERFIRDTAPPVAAEPSGPGPWVRAALLEGVDREPSRGWI